MELGRSMGLREYIRERKKVAQSCQTLAIPSTVAHQAPQSMGFSRQEYWSGLHFLLQGIFPTQGSNPGFPHCRQVLYRLSHQELDLTPEIQAVTIVWKSEDRPGVTDQAEREEKEEVSRPRRTQARPGGLRVGGVGVGVSLDPAGLGLFKVRHLCQRGRESVRSRQQVVSRPSPRASGADRVTGAAGRPCCPETESVCRGGRLGAAPRRCHWQDAWVRDSPGLPARGRGGCPCRTSRPRTGAEGPLDHREEVSGSSCTCRSTVWPRAPWLSSPDGGSPDAQCLSCCHLR